MVSNWNLVFDNKTKKLNENSTFNKNFVEKTQFLLK